jgi:hypothetical protein
MTDSGTDSLLIKYQESAFLLGNSVQDPDGSALISLARFGIRQQRNRQKSMPFLQTNPDPHNILKNAFVPRRHGFKLTIYKEYKDAFLFRGKTET